MSKILSKEEEKKVESFCGNTEEATVGKGKRLKESEREWEVWGGEAKKPGGMRL